MALFAEPTSLAIPVEESHTPNLTPPKSDNMLTALRSPASRFLASARAFSPWVRRQRRNRCRASSHADYPCVALFALLAITLTFVPAWGVTLDWTRQLGTTSSDVSYGVAADSLGNVYLSGQTAGSLVGANAGGQDAFVSKYDAAGTLQWTRQLGTSAAELGDGVSADSLGNVYLSGWTQGSLGGTNFGGQDAFVSKYDAAGTLQWTRQLGTTANENSAGASADGLGSVFISGNTFGSLEGTSAGDQDAFVSKYDATGNLQWTRQFGTNSEDACEGVSADGLGNVYISGWTRGDLGGRTNVFGIDAFVRKYDSSGNLQWNRQFGNGTAVHSKAVSTDGLGNVYISGQISIGGANYDAFVSKYDAAGTFQWTRQLGTSFPDYSLGVSADALGNLYISGYTEGGSLDGTNAGGYDAFVSKYDAAGTLQWTRQLGTKGTDISLSVSADGQGHVYLSGLTDGDLNNPNVGGTDAFVAKYSEISVPEPSTLALIALAGAPVVRFRRRANQRLFETCMASAFLAAVSFGGPAATADIVGFGSGVNAFSMEFVRIGNPGNPADTTGSPNPAGSVAYNFNMGKFEVSRDMVAKASAAGNLGITLADMTSFGGNGVNRPATGVSWNEAARFVNWLNTSQGFTPAYKFTTAPDGTAATANQNIALWASGDAGFNAANPFRNSQAHYFLPSVDEWYKAAYYDPASGTYVDYPTGSNTAPTGVASGTSANTAVYGQRGSTGPADIMFAGDLSFYGTMGQGGQRCRMG